MSRINRRIVFRIMKLMSIAVGSVLGIFCNFGGTLYGPAPEYGMPHADFKISGAVKSAPTDSLIRGISISLRDTLDSSIVTDSVLTDSLGRYSIEFTDVPWNNTWILRANDIDGIENGSFFSKDTIIGIPESEISGGDGKWYEGRGEKNVDLGLEEGP